jgi:CO/xanthine dehydrogenase Mo-binding subunit
MSLRALLSQRVVCPRVVPRFSRPEVLARETVVDCGLALNPLGLDGQTESSIAWGLSAALCGKIDFRDGAAVPRSYIVSTKFREAQ